MANININTQEIRAQMIQNNAAFAEDFWFGRFIECLAHEAEEEGHALVQDEDLDGFYLVDGEDCQASEEFIQSAVCASNEAWLAVQRGIVKH